MGLKNISYIFFLVVFLSAAICEEKSAEKAAEPAKPAEPAEPAEPAKSETEPKEENNVLVLTEDNFDSVVNSREIILVEFYAPWCGHCKQLEPEYAAAAKELKENKPPVTLAKVDATVQESLAQKYGVQGYPTLIFFKNGQQVEYDGGRDKAGIVSYMKERADPNWKPPPPAVMHLTTANFDEAMKNNDYILVEFYAPWCGHCKQLAPEYEKAAKQLKTNDPPIPLAAVDATKETELAKRFKVEGYPSLKLFRKGKPSEYNGPREADGIARWMIENRVDAAKMVTSTKEVDDMKQNEKVLVTGFFDGNEETPLLRAFLDATNNLREDFPSAQIRNSEITASVGGPKIILYMPKLLGSGHEKKEKIFEKNDPAAKDVENWVKENQYPLVGHYTGESSKFYDDKRPLCIFFFSVDFSFDHRKATQMWRAKISDIAKDYPSVTFAVANDEQQEDKLKELQLDDTGEDMNVGCWDKDSRRFPMPAMDEWESEHVRGFLNKFVADKLKPVIKSQPLPMTNTGAVKVLVGKNFEEVVNDPTKDVLVEFYAPWCGHCKEFEPKYESMAKELAKTEPNLVLAKMDATANDAPKGYKVEGFPTIYFAPANSKDAPSKYEGNREVNDLKTFMEQHASAAFKAAQATFKTAEDTAGAKPKTEL